MKALVTGSSGFLGRHVTSALSDSAFSVTCLDVASPEAPHSEFLQCDLTDRHQVEEAVTGKSWDIVMHLAGVRGSLQEMQQVNINGTVNLMRLLKNNCRRFIMASSCAVYGNPLSPSGIVSENHQTVPVTDYGRNMMKKERMALEIADMTEVEFCAVRLFNLFGPGQPPTMMAASLLEKLYLIKNGLAPPPLRTGPLSTLRDLVDVRDAADAMVSLGKVGIPLPSVLNVGTGTPVKGTEVLTALQNALNTDIPLEEAPGAPGDIRCIFSDNRLLAETTGWKPAKSLRETIRDMVAYVSEGSI